MPIRERLRISLSVIAAFRLNHYWAAGHTLPCSKRARILKTLFMKCRAALGSTRMAEGSDRGLLFDALGTARAGTGPANGSLTTTTSGPVLAVGTPVTRVPSRRLAYTFGVRDRCQVASLTGLVLDEIDPVHLGVQPCADGPAIRSAPTRPSSPSGRSMQRTRAHQLALPL